MGSITKHLQQTHVWTKIQFLVSIYWFSGSSLEMLRQLQTVHSNILFHDPGRIRVMDDAKVQKYDTLSFPILRSFNNGGSFTDLRFSDTFSS